MPKRFAFFANIPTPHKVYLFNLLNERLNGDIVFYFLAKTSPKRKSWEDSLKYAQFEYEILKSWRISINFSDEGYWFIPKDLPNFSDFKKIVISGGLTPVELFLALKCLANNVPYIVWSEAINLFGGNLIFRTLRIPIRFLIFSNAEHVVCGSSMAKEHAERLGARNTSVIYTTTNIDRFLYDKHHSGKCLNVAYIGRLIKRKNVDVLLKALHNERWVNLYMVGEGEEKERLYELSMRLNIDVKFLGWKDYDEIPRLLKKFDVMVLPSKNEVFGYVVVEALSSGVIPVVSEGVGAKDLVDESLRFKTDDIEKLKTILRKLKSPNLRNELSSRMKGNLNLIKGEGWAESFANILLK